MKPRPIGVITPEMVAEANAKVAECKPNTKLSAIHLAGQHAVLHHSSDVITNMEAPYRVVFHSKPTGTDVYFNGSAARTGVLMDSERFHGMVTAYVNSILESLPCQIAEAGSLEFGVHELREIIDSITEATNGFLTAAANYDPEPERMYNLSATATGSKAMLNSEFTPYDPLDGESKPHVFTDGFSEPQLEALWKVPGDDPDHAEQLTLLSPPEDDADITDVYTDEERALEALNSWDEYDDAEYGYGSISRKDYGYEEIDDDRVCAYDLDYDKDRDCPPTGVNHAAWDWYDYDCCWNPEIDAALDTDHFICAYDCTPYIVTTDGRPSKDSMEVTRGKTTLFSCPASPDDMILPIKDFVGALNASVRDIFIDLARKPEAEGITLNSAQLYLALIGDPLIGCEYIHEANEYCNEAHIEFQVRGTSWSSFRLHLVNVLSILLDYTVDAPSGSMAEAECIDAQEVIGHHVDVAAYDTYVKYHTEYLKKNP